MKKQKTKAFFLLALPFIFNLGCTAMNRKDLPEQKTVEHIELPRFMGRWYVIASIPTRFEKGAFNATETYTWNEKKQQIDIDFRFNQDSATGPEKKIPQRAFIYNEESKAEWRVQPFWPLKFAYLIVGIANDYSDTVIGVPDRGNVWIMARTPKIDETRYAQLVSQIQNLGYDIGELKKVPQIWP
jgi:apolipoprotein D and lipocalin family protein